MQSEWRCYAMSSSKEFEKVMDRQKLTVPEIIDSSHHKEIEANRVKLRSIVPTILVCGTHDLPIRGKIDDGSVFTDLLHFRIESGDNVLRNHLDSGGKNSLYTSHRIQIDLIDTCSNALREEIIKEVKQASVFSVLADETADIGGVEQLSIAVHYLCFEKEDNNLLICEEFLTIRTIVARVEC